MFNSKNLTLKLNKSLQNLALDSPATPLEQTLKTPIDTPLNPQATAHYFQGASLASSAANGNSIGMNPLFNLSTSSFVTGFPHPPAIVGEGHSIYNNPHYSQSDDVLTDIDEPFMSNGSTNSSFSGPSAAPMSYQPKVYTLQFNSKFDQLLYGIYSHILSLPTTTPFSGNVPPSGLTSKVANECLTRLMGTPNVSFDQHNIINMESLKNYNYQPIFLHLIRKRLIELCTFSMSSSKLPLSTSVTINYGYNGNSFQNGNSNNSGSNNPYSTFSSNRQLSISNLPLSDLATPLNSSAQGQTGVPGESRSRSSSLRKHTLSRNNSYSSNSWLHVGNITNVRNNHFNASTDSLLSINDFHPLYVLNRPAAGSVGTQGAQNGAANVALDLQPPSFSAADFHTPPHSQKGSITEITPPPTQANGFPLPPGAAFKNPLISSNSMASDLEEFNFYSRSRSTSLPSRSNSLPYPALTINVNANQPDFHAPSSGLASFSATAAQMAPPQFPPNSLDSPFLSSTNSMEDTHGGFSPYTAQSPLVHGFLINQTGASSIPPSPVAGMSQMALDSPGGNNSEVPAGFSFASKVSLSEKKRDSLKLKRGIH